MFSEIFCDHRVKFDETIWDHVSNLNNVFFQCVCMMYFFSAYRNWVARNSIMGKLKSHVCSKSVIILQSCANTYPFTPPQN